MKISEICIKRPVFAWVMTFIIVLVGIVFWTKLPLQYLPKFDRPIVNVETNLPGAGPEIVEAQITRLMEEAFSGIDGVEEMTSVSKAESSEIILEINERRRVDDVINDVRDRISKTRDQLPRDSNEPIISKTKSDGNSIMQIVFSSGSMDDNELYDYVSQDLRNDFECVEGVGAARVYGGGMFNMMIYLNPQRMAAHGITVSEVAHVVRSQNIEKPAGKIVNDTREYLVTTMAKLESPEEFDNLIVSAKDGHLVRIKDIGKSKIKTDTNSKTITWFNGKKGISISIVKQSDANPLQVSKLVRKKLENLKLTKLPREIEAVVAYDSTKFIKRSIEEVYRTIFEAVLLVTFVVLIFLKSFRASLIPLITIPVSLIGSMIFMSILGFSLNMFTLIAFVLAVGLVVDDAIVVLENIHRYIERGESRIVASIKGIKEVSFSVVAMTLTLAAVYTPVLFARGLTGKLLKEFSLTLSCAVIISGFVALTLSPMMCSRILATNDDLEKQKTTLYGKFKSKINVDNWLDVLSVDYSKLLKKSLIKKWYVIIGTFLFAGIGYFTFSLLPSFLFPKEDTGSIQIRGYSPQSATLKFSEKYVSAVDKILNSIPEIETRTVSITNPSFDVEIDLKNRISRSSEDVAEEVRRKISEVAGVQILSVSAGSGESGASKSNNISFVVRGNRSHREINEFSRLVAQKMMRDNLTNGLTTNAGQDTRDYVVSILRDKVSSFFIAPLTISESIDALMRGHKVGTFKKDNKLYDVKVAVENASKSSPEDIMNIYVKGETNEKNQKLIPLSELVSISERTGPVSIYHHKKTRSVSLSCELTEKYSMREAINYLIKQKNNILPNDVMIDFTGNTKTFIEDSGIMAYIFMLAIIFIYLVMAAQFESWRDPFIILFSVPMALIGAIITLSLTKNGSINLYSEIGLITLIGLISKHGILLVDFANKLQMDGKNKHDAIVEASLTRLRPILMTTFAMVLGALPLVFAAGAGKESRWQLGLTIVGGMTFGTVFTLFVVPAFYVVLSKVKKINKKLTN